MYDKYIKSNILPITLEFLLILCFLLLNSKYHIYTNFLFYILLAIYFYWKKDFSLKEWLKSVKSGQNFWKQVVFTILFFSLAFIITSVLKNTFSHLDTGMISLKVDNWFELILFISSTIIFPPIVEETFYRKNLITFKNRKALIITTLFSMFLYALEHTLTVWGILLCMIWALPLSISYIKTKNIYVPITAHLICNLVVNGFTIIKILSFLIYKN